MNGKSSAIFKQKQIKIEKKISEADFNILSAASSSHSFLLKKKKLDLCSLFYSRKFIFYLKITAYYKATTSR